MLQKVHLGLSRALPFVELVQLCNLPVQLLGGWKSTSWARAMAPQRLQTNNQKEERLRSKRGKAVLRGYTTCCWAEVMAKKRIVRCIADKSSRLLLTLLLAKECPTFAPQGRTPYIPQCCQFLTLHSQGRKTDQNDNARCCSLLPTLNFHLLKHSKCNTLDIFF